MRVASRRVVAGFCVAAPLRHDERLVVANVPGGSVGAFRVLLVPADIFVGADDVERFAKWVIDNFGSAACRIFFRADEERGSDEARGVELMRQVDHGGEVFGAGFGVGSFVGDGPEDDGRLVVVAPNHLGELLFGFYEDGGVIEPERPVVGDLGPDHEAEAVGSASHALVVRVVGEADVVAPKFLSPAEEGVDVVLGVGAAGAHGRFGVDGDPAEEDGLAVEKDLGAADFDGAEAHVVFELVGAGGELDLVEPGVFGGPEAEGFDGQADGVAGVGVDGGLGLALSSGIADGDRRYRWVRLRRGHNLRWSCGRRG